MAWLRCPWRRCKAKSLPLPERAVAGLPPGRAGSRKALLKQAASCSRSLRNTDMDWGNFYERLAANVEVPDEYSFAMRVFGLYPLAYLPEKIVTARVRERFRTLLATPPEKLPIEGSLMSYGPGAAPSLTGAEVTRILKRASANALKTPLPAGKDARILKTQKRGSPNAPEMPLPVGRDARLLVAQFAPIFIQDTVAPYDESGRVAWGPEGLTVDTKAPTIYHYFTHTFLKGSPALQINYVIWYPRRAGPNSPSIEQGKLDGLTVRVSLGRGGKGFHGGHHEQLRLLPPLPPEPVDGRRRDRVVLARKPLRPPMAPGDSLGQTLGHSGHVGLAPGGGDLHHRRQHPFEYL